jgi:hypothetical protein
MRSAAIFSLTIVLIAGSPASAEQKEYKGLCEASAAVALDDNHFAVASDETNVVLIYRKGKLEPVHKADFEDFTTFDKSDLEGAARIGSRVYWITSHSFNKDGKDRPKRKLFFASEIKAGAGGPTLKPVGKPYFDLRDPLASAAGVPKFELNIEGLAATEQGALLIGLRGPLKGGQAVVVPLNNPAEVIDKSKAPRFGNALLLDLKGLGIRSIDRVGTGDHQFIISAGPVEDAKKPFRLYWWSGRATDKSPKEIQDVSLDGLIPEAVISFSNESSVHVLSDDGGVCSDEKSVELRRFRSREIPIQQNRK